MAKRVAKRPEAEPLPDVDRADEPQPPIPRGAGGSTARRRLVEQSMMEHASRLFAARGFAGTSLQDVADAMGLTRPALYYYVKSKEELLSRLIAEITLAPAAALWTVANREDLPAAEKLRTVASMAADQNATHASEFRLLVRSEAELPPDVYEAYTRGRRSVLEAVTTIIEAGVLDGSFRPVDAKVAAFGVLGICNWVAWWFHPDGRFDQSEVRAALAEQAVRGLLREDGRELRSPDPAGAVGLLREDLDLLERLLSRDADTKTTAPTVRGRWPEGAGPALEDGPGSASATTFAQ